MTTSKQAARFTAGPWYIGSTGRNGDTRITDDLRGGAHGDTVAVVPGSRPKANARLIAASPALYAALEALASAVARFRPDPDWCEPEIAAARAALASARGEG